MWGSNLRVGVWITALVPALLWSLLARAEERPNILLIVTDDQSPFDLRAYEPVSQLETPVLDGLAARGIVLDAAYHMGSFSGAVCTPSRHMIMTGRGLWHLPLGPKSAPAVAPNDGHRCPADILEHVLPAVFDRAGYDTMRTCKQGNSYEAANRRFAVRHDATKREGTAGEGSAWHADRVLEFLEARDEAEGSAPFLIFLGFSHPHDTRDGTPALLAKYGATNHTDRTTLPSRHPDQPPLPANWLPRHPFDTTHSDVRDEVAVSGVWDRRDEATIRNEAGRQHACAENIDIQIGRVLDRLAAGGELDNTWIFFTSDHGIAVGRHGLQGKQNLYEHTWRVPLIVAGPGVKPGSRAPGNVYLTDLLATLCEVAGIEPPASNEGRSFLPVLTGDQPQVRDILYGAYCGGQRPGIRAVRRGDWKLIEYESATGERHTQLFNLRDNPLELLAEHHDPAIGAVSGVAPLGHQRNLAADPAHAARRASLELDLLEEMRRLHDPFRFAYQPADNAPAATTAVGDGIPAEAGDLPGFDFTKPTAAAEWLATHDVADVRHSPEGLLISIEGDDPYVTGPARDYPGDMPLRMTLVVRPSADGVLQVFYFSDHAREEASVTVLVRGGEWNTVQALLPPLGAGTRLRLDPPGQAGTALIERIGFTPAVTLPAAAWPAHEVAAAAGLRLESGPAAVAVSDRGFALELNGERIAASHARPLIGFLAGGKVQWIEANPPAEVQSIQGGEQPAAIETRQRLRDAAGGTWQIRRRFTVGSLPGLIDLETAVDVDRDRAVAFLPLMLLVAHEGTTAKQQAVFPGLEYLADEPSSSEADLVGPQARRQVPSSHKITFPLMAVAHAGRVAGLIWDHRPDLAAVFDSPDRLLGSGGHLLGVIAPGSDGLNRIEGELMPLEPVVLAAGKRLTLRCSLFAGRGKTIAPSVQAYVDSRGLPDVPKGDGLERYVRQATAGWLDSGIRAGGRFRHAIGPAFPPQPAADAAVFIRWLAGQAGAAAARSQLEEAAAEAIAAVPAGSLDAAAIGHVRMPVQSLLFGRIEETAAAHAAIARRLLDEVRPDGTVAYRPGEVDYGRTHDADHANGLSARVVADALESARFAGDEPLITEAVGALRRLGQTYAGSVPRGAQTWEVPLHTPDILATAHLVRAFTIGYELTADRHLLDEAVAWAWTGLPFLYLVDPVGTADGPYGCVTVFGATAWERPVWIGRPVQWCGLVHAHALYRLARHDPAGPWRQLADGITATGIRYSWPVAPPGASADVRDRQGLLPDGWEVLERHRLDPPINPGTLQACAVEFFRQGPLLDSRVLPFGAGRLIVHAPGAIEPVAPAERSADQSATQTANSAATVMFRVTGWPRKLHAVSVAGLAAEPTLTLNGEPLSLAPPHRFDSASGRLTLWLDAAATIGLRGKPRSYPPGDEPLRP